MNPNISIFLNISRWFAAFLVLLGHLRQLILVDFKYVEQKTLICKALYFVTGFGHEAVMVFFVISGFLVGSLTLKRWRSNGSNLSAYVSARVSRIYTVLIPALLAGLALDFIGLHWFNSSELYTNSAQYHTISLNSTISADIGIATFFGNLFNLQGILVQHFGSNGPLWSLANEWWYYSIFALVGMVITGSGNKRFAYAIAAIALASFLPPSILLYGTVWALGFIAHAWINSSVWRPNPLLGLVVFLIIIITSRLSHNTDSVANPESLLSGFFPDFIVGVGYVIALASASKMTIPFKWLHDFLAEFSFTTYLFHFPAMVFIVAIGYQIFGLRFQVQPSASGYLYMFVATAILYLYCFVFYQLTEKHTVYVREKLDSYALKW